MKKTVFNVLLFVFIYIPNISKAQENTSSEEKHLSIQFLLAHTQIQEAPNENGEKTWISVPSFELNYNYEIP
ncbi:MAG: hypothetical protein ACK5M1_02975 [Xanthomarina gelatinilytica]|uniref:hypothetical protein n=1 Tax=Xanthomarina gelatinilytica TaxID=1137281 RepID=UPI003A87E08A